MQMIGRTISHYEIGQKLGEGGMGVVYRARDTRLNRFVALKFLPNRLDRPDADPFRFVQEARTASALDHPNICTVHDIEKTDDGQMFIVMACYEGETLQTRLERGPLPVLEAVTIAQQIGQGLGRAHERGIVHRDIKPSNVFLTRDGLVKILDFGVSRLLDESGITRTGAHIGTVRYMSPEQARGEPADQRSDVWALGVVLHEMLTGRPAFEGTQAVVLQAIQTRDPVRLATARPETPRAVVDIVERALQKDPADRFADGRAMAEALAAAAQLQGAAAHTSALTTFRRPAVLIPVTVTVLALVGALGWFVFQSNRASWARNQALPEIARLADGKQFASAAALASRAERYLPGDPVLSKLWTDIAVTMRIESQPSGALVEFRPYDRPSDPWRSVGTTPIGDLRLPRGAYRWRFSRAGSGIIERAGQAVPATLRVQLPDAGVVPDGMVPIWKSTDALMLAGLGLPQEITLEDFFIQRHEVSNRDYKKFVDAGGYRRRELWKHDFVDAGKPLTWEEAMARFRDKAGQSGPATWEVGAYPPGEDDLPVSGVSWYEAAAYAEFAGLTLPTLHHWYRAADITAGPFLVPVANFDYRGPRAVGTSGAMSPSGAVDMAGNVREWVWNGTRGGLRYSLGGAFGEPQYMFGQIEAISPFARSPQNGFRCASIGADGPPNGRAAATFDRIVRDFRSEQAVGDETFAQYTRMFAYAKSPLEARLEKTLDSGSDVRVERVTFTAAYEGERVIAYLWLPKTAKPPYQTLVLFPGGEAMRPAGPDVLEQPDRYDFIVRSGRAVVHPVYRGMYERYQPRPTDPISFRNGAIRWIQDLRRTVDYLETRPDIDRQRLGYFGSSLGAGFGPIALVLEPRLRLALLIGGGLASFNWEPEVYSFNYLPRVKVPVLLMGGRHDYFLPLETSQKPFFERLGTPAEHKKHIVVEAAHSLPRHEYVREMLAWLDKYFGPAR